MQYLIIFLVTISVIPINTARILPKVNQLGINLQTGLRLRTLDSIQLATAQLAQEALRNSGSTELITFLSADAQLLRVAVNVGFNTENPENHP
jgi:hypothetical protein